MVIHYHIGQKWVKTGMVEKKWPSNPKILKNTGSRTLQSGGGEREEIQFLSSGPYIPDSTTFSTISTLTNEFVLREKFLSQGLSAAHIATELGVSKTTVKARLRAFGIRKNTPNGKSRYNLALGEKMVKGRVRPHKAELQVLKTILTMHTKKGLSPTSIADILNTMKIPTKRQGKKWSNSVIIDILKREEVYEPVQKKTA